MPAVLPAMQADTMSAAVWAGTMPAVRQSTGMPAERTPADRPEGGSAVEAGLPNKLETVQPYRKQHSSG